MQEMKYFIPNDTFDNAIRNKEKGVLRALLIGIIGSDPTFATTEYDEANIYVKYQSERINGSTLNLSEVYQEQEDEYTKSQEDWNEEYYKMLLVWYRDNYANERLKTIEKVGKEVYKNKPTLGKSKCQNRVTQQTIYKQGTIGNTQSKKKALVVRSTDNDVRKTRLIFIDWLKQNWWFAIIGIGVVVLGWLLLRK